MTDSKEPVNKKDDTEELREEVLVESTEEVPDLGAFEMTPEPEYTEILDNAHEEGDLTENVVVPSDESPDEDIEAYNPPVEVTEAPAGGAEAKVPERAEVTENTVPSLAGAKESPTTPVPKKSHRLQYAALLIALVLIIGGSFAVIYLSFGGELYAPNDRVA